MSPAATALNLSSHFPDGGEWDDAYELDGEATADAERHAAGHASHEHAGRIALVPDDTHGIASDKPSLNTLRSQVATIVAGNHSAGPAWPTGVKELDAALGGGVPRGRVTEIVGTLGAGKTTLARQLVARVLAEGGWVAWVDATRTLAPQELAGLGQRLIMVRPRDHTRGAWCADLLLRSGVFALVVLDGAPVLSRVTGVRLSQLARERDAAFVVLREGTQASRLGGAVRLQVKPRTKTRVQVPAHASMHTHGSARTGTSAPVQVSLQRNYSVLVEKGGAYRTVEVNCAIVMARRVCTDSEIPDRRGVARRTRTADSGVSESGNEQSQHEQQREQATVAAAGQQLLRDFTRKGRGRPRAAESGYGRFTRRGEARKLLRAREHAGEQRHTQHQQSQYQQPQYQS